MFFNQINMTIFNENKARPDLDSVSLSNNTKMFFDMSKIITKEPVLQRNGMVNSAICSYLIT
jgi:hypothetical protein